MNEPTHIARGIVSSDSFAVIDRRVDLIAAALHEWGEECAGKARVVLREENFYAKSLKEADAEGYARGLLERHKPGDPLCDKCDEAGYRRGLKDLMDWIKSDAQCKDKKCPHHDLATCIETRIQRGTGGGE